VSSTYLCIGELVDKSLTSTKLDVNDACYALRL